MHAYTHIHAGCDLCAISSSKSSAIQRAYTYTRAAPPAPSRVHQHAESPRMRMRTSTSSIRRLRPSTPAHRVHICPNCTHRAHTRHAALDVRAIPDSNAAWPYARIRIRASAAQDNSSRHIGPAPASMCHGVGLPRALSSVARQHPDACHRES
jgi:hypothetical protein